MLEELQDFRHPFWALSIPTGVRWGASSWSERQQLVGNSARRRAEWEFPSLWLGQGVGEMGSRVPCFWKRVMN